MKCEFCKIEEGYLQPKCAPGAIGPLFGPHVKRIIYCEMHKLASEMLSILQDIGQLDAQAWAAKAKRPLTKDLRDRITALLFLLGGKET